MLKLTYGLLYNSRVCCRSAYIFPHIKELSTTNVLEANVQKTNVELQVEEASSTQPQQFKPITSRSKIVTAVFASLGKDNKNYTTEISTPHTDQRISNATNVEELLSVSNGQGVSRRIALKIVSVLADWTTAKKIQLTDFENDYRFIKLCKLLTKSNKPERYSASKSEDLSTVLSVTADEEAAKLIQNVTLPQMVKIMQTLSAKKRRSPLLLRTLAFNIAGSADKLNLKHSSDLLYSMSSLNFFDENLLSKISLDVCNEIESEPEVKTSAVIGSILMSLGLLKYKSPIVLDYLSNWLMKNCDTCRSQDVFTFFVTLATLNYLPMDFDKLIQVFSPYLTESEAGNSITWLDHIWAKVILNIATSEDVSHVLNENFINSLLEIQPNNVSVNLKLLNISGAAECLMNECKQQKLADNSPFRLVALPKRKNKTEIAESIVSALKNLMNTEKYLKVNTNTGYGFSVAAECILDEKFNPKEFNSNKGGTRIAIMPLDYHDLTKGSVDPTGINVFARRILEAKGYKVLEIPYFEFNPQSKLVSRVQYLEKNLKELVKKK